MHLKCIIREKVIIVNLRLVILIWINIHNELNFIQIDLGRSFIFNEDSNTIYLFFFYWLQRGKRGQKRGRETSTWERNIDGIPLAHAPTGHRTVTQARALIGNQTWELSIGGMMPNQLSHTGQGRTLILSNPMYWKLTGELNSLFPFYKNLSRD